MLTPIATVILALGCVALGIVIAEYYHHRIDQAKQGKPQEMWDLSPAPQPKIVGVNDYTHRQRAGGGRS